MMKGTNTFTGEAFTQCKHKMEKRKEKRKKNPATLTVELNAAFAE